MRATGHWILVIVLAAAPAFAQSTPDRFVLEDVASLPSLIGTAPASPAWSPDGRRLAFLWNDKGWPGRNVWIVNADGSGLRWLSDFDPMRTGVLPSGTSTPALAAAASARARSFATELHWVSPRHLLALVGGGLLLDIDVDAARDGVRELASLPGASDVSLSPDGATIAFLRDGDLWTMPRQTGTRAGARRLTALGLAGIATVPLGTYNRADREVGTGVWGADWAPYAWSPDGTRIVFHAVDRRHLRKVPFPSYLGDETIVSELRRGYPGDENERRTLHVVDPGTRTVTDLGLPEPGRRAVTDVSWSPSGRLLVDHVSDDGTERWLYVVEAGQTRLRLVWHDRRDTRIYPAYVAHWHPDGRRIVVVADLAERDQLFVIDPAAASPAPVAISPADWDVAGERGAATVQVVPAAGAIYFTGTGQGPYERHVYRLGDGDTAPQRLTTAAGVHVPVVSPDGRSLATIWSDDVTPPQLLVGEASPGATLTPVTTPPAGFGERAWVRPRYQAFRNTVHGFDVHARILEPPDLDRSRRHPVIFGPMYSNTVRNRWGGLNGTLQQWMAQHGYIVVQVDVRGSVGYGRRFREAFLMDYGNGDLDDVQAVVDGMKALPYVDGTRIGIWGSSYGGLLTLHALLKRPGLFAAGVAAAPAVDPRAFGPDDVAITRDPGTHPEAFMRGSALGLGDTLQDRLLVIHGLMDDVVPFRTTMALVERLILLGKDVDLATAPAATHAWSSREAYAIYFFKKLTEYFDRFLKPALAASP
ncbi:MAG: prolyl oligopeptidase family serine peptidase [Vicinamibacterales bacterium]